MPIRNAEQAHATLADAVWWFKGFAAARPASIDEGAGEHRLFEARLQEVRHWLNSIAQGSFRRFGDSEAVILSFAEFERLVDAVRVPRPAEISLAVQTIETVLAEYRVEETAAHRTDAPF